MSHPLGKGFLFSIEDTVIHIRRNNAERSEDIRRSHGTQPARRSSKTLCTEQLKFGEVYQKEIGRNRSEGSELKQSKADEKSTHARFHGKHPSSFLKCLKIEVKISKITSDRSIFLRYKPFINL